MSLSVLIPCHNDAAHLGAALESVLVQTRPVQEIVVVDDGSTDGSAAVAAGFGARVRLISQANQGISAARNTALSAAGGDMIAFLDADDLWPADSLERRLEILEADASIDVAVGQTEQFLSPDLDAAARLQCPPGRSTARLAGAMLARRSAFDRVGGFDTSLTVGETMDWVARATEAGLRFQAVEALVLRRRIHGGNTVLQQRSSHSDYLRVLKASLDRRAARAAGA